MTDIAMKAAFVDGQGNVARIEYVGWDDQFADGAAVGDQVVRLVPVEVSDHTLHHATFWDFDEGQFKERPPAPDQCHDWDPISKSWVRDDARKAALLSQWVNPIRDTLEGAPVQVNGHWLDVDDRSEKRMRDALMLWDQLGQTTIDWMLADNTPLTVTKAELQALYDGAIQARALRSLQLHTEARALKADLGATETDVEAWRLQHAPVF